MIEIDYLGVEILFCFSLFCRVFKTDRKAIRRGYKFLNDKDRSCVVFPIPGKTIEDVLIV